MRKRTLLFTMLAMATSIAQHQATVDNNRGEINPIVKRYGTNLPASTSYDMLKSHAADLKELGIRYVRLSAGWGQEGQGLYNNKQVSVNGDFIEYYCQIYSPRETG